MSVVPGGKAQQDKVKFSYVEYQVFMLLLAGIICSAIGLIEVAMRRFQVLPLLFPGVFSVQRRRFYFFTYDVSDGALGKQIRAQAKMLIRMNLCIVLSYLWQHCVMETTQSVGTGFPKKECEDNLDCFASKFHIETYFTWKHTSIDCGGVPSGFTSRTVVTCVRFIPPMATTWLMHLAIAHSVTQLNFKAYEVLVWIAGNSMWFRRCVGVLIVISLSAFVALLFSGLVTEFVSSWLSFVMSLSIPLFFYIVFKTGVALELLWRMDVLKVQTSIESHLDHAFQDIEQCALNADTANQEITPYSRTNNARIIDPMGLITQKSNMLSRFVSGLRKPGLPSLLRNSKSRNKIPRDEDGNPIMGHDHHVDGSLSGDRDLGSIREDSQEHQLLRPDVKDASPDQQQWEFPREVPREDLLLPQSLDATAINRRAASSQHSGSGNRPRARGGGPEDS
jgi:hypothetical protein